MSENNEKSKNKNGQKRKINLPKVVKGLVFTAAVSFSAFIGYKARDILPELSSNVRIGTIYNPELGIQETCIIEENSGDGKCKITKMSPDSEPETIEVPESSIGEYGKLSESEFETITEENYSIPEGSSVFLRTGTEDDKDNIIKKADSRFKISGSKLMYTKDGYAVQVFEATMPETKLYTRCEELGVSWDNGKVRIENENITISDKIDPGSAKTVVSKERIPVYAKPEKGEIIGYIEEETEIKTTEGEWEDPIGDIPIIKKGYIIVYDNNGNLLGYVNKGKTQETELTNENYKKILEHTVPSSDGRYLGIDAKDITPDMLDNMLSDFSMGKTLKIEEKEYNTSELDETNIAYVIIRMGASGFGQEMGYIDNPNCVELAQVCKDHNIPFSLYYFSTSVTVEEAKTEEERVSKKLQEIKDANLTPSSIYYDAELSGEEDRMFGKDVTNAKGELIIETEGIAKKIFNKNIPIGLYTNYREVNPESEEKIIDLNKLQDNYGKDILFWVPLLKDENGKTNEETKEFFSKYGSIAISQNYQDINQGDIFISINLMSEEDYMTIMLGMSPKEIKKYKEEQEEQEEQEKQDEKDEKDEKTASFINPIESVRQYAANALNVSPGNITFGPGTEQHFIEEYGEDDSLDK